MDFQSRATFDNKLKNSFLENLGKLSFLPKVVSFGILLVSICVFSLVNDFGYLILPERSLNSSINIITPNLVIQQNEIFELENQQKQALASQVKLSLVQNDSNPCSIILQNPSNTEIINLENQIFWQTESCSLPVQTIQIATLNQNQLELFSNQPNVYLNQLQGTIYSISYTTEEVSSSNLDFLQRYWFELSEPLFQETSSLVRAISTDQVRTGDFIYFLSGDCTLNSEQGCTFANFNFVNNKYEQISDNLKLLLNNLPQGSQIIFAKNQDEFPKVINFIITQDNSSTFKLVRFSLETKNILQVLDINQQTDAQNYKRFFR
jgi:hypothetical protein